MSSAISEACGAEEERGESSEATKRTTVFWMLRSEMW